jgi:hypothetical protein
LHLCSLTKLAPQLLARPAAKLWLKINQSRWRGFSLPALRLHIYRMADGTLTVQPIQIRAQQEALHRAGQAAQLG